jgi:PPOX class probable F420-dependent enzyme
MALDDTARRFFHAPNLIHVATVLPSGAPHTVPVWCRLERGRIAFFTQPATRKARNLALDPRVAISAVSHENPYSMVQVRGRVAETLVGEAALTVIDRISHDYIGGPLPMRSGIVFLVEADRVHQMDLPFEH